MTQHDDEVRLRHLLDYSRKAITKGAAEDFDASGQSLLVCSGQVAAPYAARIIFLIFMKPT
jgi:hypothetical protein